MLATVSANGLTTVQTDDCGEYPLVRLPPAINSSRPFRSATALVAGIGARETTDADIRRAEQQLRSLTASAPSSKSVPSAESTPGRTGYAPMFYPGVADAGNAISVTLWTRRRTSRHRPRLPPASARRCARARLHGRALPSGVQIRMTPAGPALPPQGFGLGVSLNGYATAQVATDGTFSIDRRGSLHAARTRGDVSARRRACPAVDGQRLGERRRRQPH